MSLPTEVGAPGTGPAAISRPTILVVDDEVPVCELLKGICGESYMIQFAAEGAAAIEILKHHPVEVIISDFCMPGMSGVEVLGQVAELQPEAARIMMSGYAEADVVIEAVNKGHIHFFLPKPFKEQEVWNVLRQATGYSAVLRERRELVCQLEQLNRELEQRIQQRTAELRELSEQRGLVLEAAELGAWDYRLDTGESYKDPRRCRMLGLPPGTRLDFNGTLACVHPEDRPAVQNALSRAFAGKNAGAYQEEFRVVWPDGSVHWLAGHGRVYFDGEGEHRHAVRFIGVSKDITEEKQAAERMSALASVVENSTDLVGFATPEGKVKFLNPAGRRLVGIDEDERVQETGIIDYVMEEDREWFLDQVLPAAMRDGSWQGETRFRHRKTGQPIPMWQSIFCLTEPGTNRRLAVCTISRDLTARKFVEAELLNAKEAAEAADRAKSQFLANMSHEIRTPMNGVMGANELLLQTELDPEQQSYLEIARISGERMLVLINEILDFSKIEARQVTLDQSDFDLRTILKQVVDLVAIEAQKKGLSLTWQVSPEAPQWLHGDSGRLSQILLNLAGNAVKFTAHGGVAIHAAVESAQGSNIMLRFSVTDTGIGIRPEQHEIIFSPFVQADGSTTRKYGGAGLGLAISRQLLELMGGQIGVESEEGKGSTFWFTAMVVKALEAMIPKETAGAAAANAHMAAADDRANRLRILVVEDNISGQKIAVAILNKLGYDTDAVANGAEAIQALRNGDYAAVIMDCEMPGLDGYEATRLIRKPETGVRNSGIPIIALTADAMPGDREKCLQAGMSDYLAKPIGMRKVSETLATWTCSLGDGDDGYTMKPAPTVAKAVFDEENLLLRLMGDRTLAGELIQHCVHDIPTRLSSLRSTVEQGDLAGARFHAHALKGVAANVSATILRQRASEMQQASATNDMEHSVKLLPSLDAEFEEFKAALLVSGWTGWRGAEKV